MLILLILPRTVKQITLYLLTSDASMKLSVFLLALIISSTLLGESVTYDNPALEKGDSELEQKEKPITDGWNSQYFNSIRQPTI